MMNCISDMCDGTAAKHFAHGIVFSKMTVYGIPQHDFEKYNTDNHPEHDHSHDPYRVHIVIVIV